MDFKILLKLNWLSSFKKIGIMSLVLSLCLTTVFAQQVTVSGTIVDENGAPLPGVSILVKGTTVGAATNFDGKYSISGVSPQSVLVFSFVGFITQEFTVGDLRTLDVTLLEDSQQIEEVVVVGYGTRKAGEMTGSVSVVKAEEIQKIPAVTTTEVLRNVPGVTVMQSNTPGSTPNILVRGVGTINNAGPLWVVDGIPTSNVNPNDIETITVLKDAAAQAIYGTRAANGVILVTTKQGRKNQRVNVTFNLRTGNSRFVNSYDMLNTKEYGEALWLEAKNMNRENYSHPQYGSGATPRIPDYIFPNGAMAGEVNESMYNWKTVQEGSTVDTYLITKANKEGTNWLDEISRVAWFHDYSMNVNGGGDMTTYALTVGYVNQEGPLKYTGFDRWSFRSNINTDINKWLKIGQSISGTYSNQNGHLTNNAEDSAISWAYRMQPIIPVYDIGGNFAGTRVGGQTGNAQSPMHILYNNQWDNRERVNFTGSSYIELKPIEGLTVRSLGGLTYNTYFMKDINYVEKAHAERGTYDYVFHTGNKSRQWSWTNTAEYRKAIGLNDITVMLGTEAIQNDYYQATAQRYNFVSKDPDFIELSSGIDGQQNGSSRSSWALFSIFARVNYVYDSKYLLEGVVRRDGSSRFSEGNRYGIFPAVSLGWVISREQFMASTRTWLDNLKLRGGYGLTGNDQMGNYNSYTTYSLTSNSDDQHSFYPLAGQQSGGNTGYRNDALGNDNVKWETTRTTNVGIDAALFRSINVTFDVYQRRTTDMLYPRAVPAVFGRANAPSVNVGEMLNKGFDIDVAYRGTALNRDLRYRLSLNVSRYKNELITLTGNDDEFLDGGGFREQIYTRTKTGTSFPEFYGYVVEGIFQTDAEAASHPRTFGDASYNKPGHFKYKDVNNDGVVNADDRKFIGSPHPTFVTGLNFNFEYKGFDLNGQLYASVGNKMVNYVNRWLNYYQFDGGRGHDYLYKSWGSPYLNGDNSKATLPMIDRNTQIQAPSTAFIEDASYLRLRNLQLGYNLTNVLSMPTVSTMRVYIQVTNLFTFTKYSGLDPDPSRGSERNEARNFGIDAGAWPTPRQILFGLSVGF